MKKAGHRITRWQLWMSCGVLLCPLWQGCSQLKQEEAAVILDVAKGLGADVKLHGELGPARFGHQFVADWGGRLEIEGHTNTGGVTAKDMLEINQQLIEVIGNVAVGNQEFAAVSGQSPAINPDAPPSQGSVGEGKQ